MKISKPKTLKTTIIDEKQEYIRNVMPKAMAAKLCTNQKDFAEIVGVSPKADRK